MGALGFIEAYFLAQKQSKPCSNSCFLMIIFYLQVDHQNRLHKNMIPVVEIWHKTKANTLRNKKQITKQRQKLKAMNRVYYNGLMIILNELSEN